MLLWSFKILDLENECSETQFLKGIFVVSSIIIVTEETSTMRIMHDTLLLLVLLNGDLLKCSKKFPKVLWIEELNVSCSVFNKWVIKYYLSWLTVDDH